MTRLVNRYWLSPMFSWNCEGLWSQQSGYWLPYSDSEHITKPKPDLVMSFTENSFTNFCDLGIDEDIRNVIFPDDSEENRFSISIHGSQKSG